MSEQTSDVAAGAVATGGRAGQLRTVNIRLFAVVAMIFIFVSSGAFGIEDMVSSSGPGLTILMLLLLPVFWAMPMALVCSELGSALPEEGGYYAWTRRAMGEFWGFQCGWWSWTCQWVDSAVYIALVEGYVATWWPQLSGFELWLIGAGLIALFAYTNIRGLNIIALSSVVFTDRHRGTVPDHDRAGLRALARQRRCSPSCPRGSLSAAASTSASPSVSGCTRATTPCRPSPARSTTRGGSSRAAS